MELKQVLHQRALNKSVSKNRSTLMKPGENILALTAGSKSFFDREPSSGSKITRSTIVDTQRRQGTGHETRRGMHPAEPQRKGTPRTREVRVARRSQSGQSRNLPGEGDKERGVTQERLALHLTRLLQTAQLTPPAAFPLGLGTAPVSQVRLSPPPCPEWVFRGEKACRGFCSLGFLILQNKH